MSATLKDIARVAGVSTTTVSYVINNKGRISEATRERVKSAIKDLSYRRQGRTPGNLALVYSGSMDSPLTPAIYQAVAEFGFALHQVACDDDSEVAPQFDARLRIAGVLVYGGLWRRRFLENLAHDFPLVLFGSSLPTMKADSVWVDNSGAIYAATDHLLSKGHRKIGFINGPATSSTSAEKETGFRRALRHFGAETSTAIVEAEAFNKEAGRQAATELLDHMPDVTGVVSGEAPLTSGLLAELEARGRSVPFDVSVISFRDDPGLRALPVATIPVPVMEISREAVSTLISRMDDPQRLGRRVIIQPPLNRTENIAQIPSS